MESNSLVSSLSNLQNSTYSRKFIPYFSLVKHEEILVFKTAPAFSPESVTAKNSSSSGHFLFFCFPHFYTETWPTFSSVSYSGFVLPLLYFKLLLITVFACAASYLSSELRLLVSVSFLTKESLLPLSLSRHDLRSTCRYPDTYCADRLQKKTFVMGFVVLTALSVPRSTVYGTVSQTFFARGPPQSFIYLCGPPTPS